MRIGIVLGHAVLAAFVLSSCGSDSTGSSVSSSSTPGTLLENPPARLASLSATDFGAALSATGSGAQLLSLASAGTGQLKCGVDFYLYHYATTGGAGESIKSSGALMVPTGGSACTGARNIVLYAHGTAMTSGYNLANIADPTNEAYSEAALNAAMYTAGQGYIVVAPNYAGYKDSTLSYHPYLNGGQNGQEMVDALTAARAAISGGNLFTTVSDSGKLFVTGYSEGGYVAMAAQRALQAKGMTVTAGVHMSGPYALEAFGDAILSGNVNIGSTVFVPLATTSYQKAYGDMYTATSDIYESAYASGIDTLLPTGIPYGTLTAGAPGSNLLFSTGKLPELALFSSTTPSVSDMTALGVPSANATQLAALLSVPANPLSASGFGSSNLLKNIVRIQYALDAFNPANMDGLIAGTGVGLAPAPAYPLRKHLAANDQRALWGSTAPTAPMLLCGGHNDPTVFYSVNTSGMMAYWGVAGLAGGAGKPIQSIDVDPSSSSIAGGIATQVATAVAGTYMADLAASATPAKLAADVGATVIGLYPSHFSITASGATPIDAQGVLIGAIAAAAEQVAVGDYTAATQVTSPTQVGTDITTAVVGVYHGDLVPPACTVAAVQYFSNF